MLYLCLRHIALCIWHVASPDTAYCSLIRHIASPDTAYCSRIRHIVSLDTAYCISAYGILHHRIRHCISAYGILHIRIRHCISAYGILHIRIQHYGMLILSTIPLHSFGPVRSEASWLGLVKDTYTILDFTDDDGFGLFKELIQFISPSKC